MQKITALFTLIVTGLLFSFPSNEVSAQVFLQFEKSKIQGNQNVNGTGGWIKCNSIDFSIQHSTSSTGGRATGRAQLGSINVVKANDNASVELIRASVMGQVFPKVKLYYMRNSGGKYIPYFVVELENARVSSFNNAVNGNEIPIENMAIEYEKIVFKQINQGKLANQFEWDIFGRTR